MAKTFNEFIIECELYPHSQEHYNIMKECSELKLMAQFIENQQYYEYDKEILESIGNVEGNYLMESASDEQMEVLEEKFIEKAKKLGNKLLDMLKKLWETFKKFLVMIVNKLDKDCRLSAKLRKDLQELSHEIQDGKSEKLDAIDKAIGELMTNDKIGIRIHRNQLNVTPLKKYNLNFLLNRKSSTKKVGDLPGLDTVPTLAAIISDTYVVVDIDKSDNCSQAIPAYELAVIGEVVMKPRATNSDFDAMLKKITSLNKEASKNGLKLVINRVNIDTAIKILEKLIERVKSSNEGPSKIVQDLRDNPDQERTGITDQAEKLNEVYTRLNVVITDTIKAYRDVCKLVEKGQEAVNAALGSKYELSDRHYVTRDVEKTPEPDEEANDRE